MNSVFGLGIVLSLQDQFSRQASLLNGSFAGLLSNAQQLCQQFDMLDTQMKLFTQMATMGMGLNVMGHEFLNFSNAIYQGLEYMTQKITKTGAEFEIYRNSLSALFKDKSIGKQKADWAAAFAARTPFEINEVTQALIGYKAAGVDATNMMAGMDGKMRPFLQYIGDMAALRPDVGMKGVLFAVREMMNGQLVSMRRRLDIDPEQILGRKIGSTVEQRVKDVVELAQKLAPNLMESLNGTWLQVISNMKDNLTRFFLGIADGGAFDAAKKSLMRISNMLNDIMNNPERLERITKNIANAFRMLWVPVDLVCRAFVFMGNAIANITEKSPLLVKIVGGIAEGLMIITGIAGGVLVFLGNLLIIFGALGMMWVTIKGFMLTLTTLKALMVSISTAAGITGGAVAATFSTVFWWVTAIIAVVALLYVAYKKNFGGLHDYVDIVILRLKIFYDSMKIIFNAFKSGNLMSLLQSKSNPVASWSSFIKFLLVIKNLINGLKIGFTQMWAVWKPVLTEASAKFKSVFGDFADLGFFDMLMSGDWVAAAGRVLNFAITLGKFIAGIAITLLMVGQVAILVAKGVIKLIVDFTKVVMYVLGAIAYGISFAIFVIVKFCSVVATFFKWLWNTTKQTWDYIKSGLHAMGIAFRVLGGVISFVWHKFASAVTTAFVVGKAKVKSFVDYFTKLFNGIIKIINRVEDFFSKGYQGAGLTITTKGTPNRNAVLGATGGEIHGEGLMYVHKNEFIANSPITDKLRKWNGTNINSSSSSNRNVDNSSYSVAFSAGSIVIQGNATVADADKIKDAVADAVMKKLKREKQLQNIRQRKPVLSN